VVGFIPWPQGEGAALFGHAAGAGNQRSCGKARSRPLISWRRTVKTQYTTDWNANNYWSATSTGSGSHANVNLNNGNVNSNNDNNNNYVALEVV
jgi:hypothetical protein